MTSIGIIGFGRFGKLITRYLAEDFDVYVHSKKNNKSKIKSLNAFPCGIEKACSSDIIIPCVPISAFEGTIKKISPLIKKKSIVADVCSVKEHPANVMKKILPKHVRILATHPMFGPDSAADSLNKRKIVLCKTRIDNSTYKKIRAYLEKKGLIIIEASPEEHDRQIAYSQALTHFIGRSLIEFNAKCYDIDTEGYKRLMHILGVVKNDSWELFRDMNLYNRHAKKMRLGFINAIKKIDNKLNETN